MGTRVTGHARSSADWFNPENDRAPIASSPTPVPTLIVSYVGGDLFPHTLPTLLPTGGGDCGVSFPSSPPSQAPLTHGAGRVEGNPTSPPTHHLVGRPVRMKFDRR
jgi:hypothetical protein